MTEWDDYYMTKSYGYTPEDEACEDKLERRLCYAMLALFTLALLLALVCVELS